MPNKGEEEQEIIINDEIIKVKNETSYGEGNKTLSAAKVTLLKNQKGREYTVFIDNPVQIVMQTTKNKGTTVRFMPVNKATELKLSIVPE